MLTVEFEAQGLETELFGRRPKDLEFTYRQIG